MDDRRNKDLKIHNIICKGLKHSSQRKHGEKGGKTIKEWRQRERERFWWWQWGKEMGKRKRIYELSPVLASFTLGFRFSLYWFPGLCPQRFPSPWKFSSWPTKDFPSLFYFFPCSCSFALTILLHCILTQIMLPNISPPLFSFCSAFSAFSNSVPVAYKAMLPSLLDPRFCPTSPFRLSLADLNLPWHG